MNAVNPIMSAALAGFAPPAAPKVDPDREALERICRLPFEYETLSRAAITNREPDFCSEAEYSTFEADEDVVIDAVDALIEKHMRELEDDVMRRMAERARSAA